VNQKRSIEQRLAIVPGELGEIREIAVAELKFFQVLDGGRKSAGNCISPAEGRRAKGQMKDCLALGQAGLPVPVRHRELIQVGQQGQRRIEHIDQHTALRDPLVVEPPCSVPTPPGGAKKDLAR
jgi:hypothetical protein